MGGSCAKPQDLELRQSASSAATEREKIRTNMTGDFFNLKISLENWDRNPTWYRHQALFFLGLLIDKALKIGIDTEAMWELEDSIRNWMIDWTILRYIREDIE